MGKNYFESKEVRCPFYLHERQQVIHCESSVPDAVTHLTFPRISLQHKHKERYCNTMHYDQCPHYKAVMQKYAEEKKTQ